MSDKKSNDRNDFTRQVCAAILGVGLIFVVAMVMHQIKVSNDPDPYAKCETLLGGTDSQCRAQVASRRLRGY